MSVSAMVRKTKEEAESSKVKEEVEHDDSVDV